MKRFAVLFVAVLSSFVPPTYAGMAPPEPIVIEMPMPSDLAVMPTLDDLACRGRGLRAIGRGFRGLGRALTPFRHR